MKCVNCGKSSPAAPCYLRHQQSEPTGPLCSPCYVHLARFAAWVDCEVSIAILTDPNHWGLTKKASS